MKVMEFLKSKKGMIVVAVAIILVVIAALAMTGTVKF